jgi:tetratricopeptide (TPR) repeat protein
MPGPEELAPGPVRDLVAEIHVFYDRAGRPSVRMISDQIFADRDLASVSRETVNALLQGRAVPFWSKVRSVVIVLAREANLNVDQAEIGRVQGFWLHAHSAHKAGRTGRARPIPRPAPQPRTEPAWDAEPEPAAAAGPPATPRGGQAVMPPMTAPSTPVEAAGTLVSRPPTRSTRPPRAEALIHRPQLVEAMRAALSAYPYAPLIVYGLAGAGKTQLVIDYLDQHEADYEFVWWVPCDTRATAIDALLRLADHMNVRREPSAEQTLKHLVERLESRPDAYTRAIVFDGASQGETRQWVPSVGAHVLVTTRDPGWAHESSSSNVEVPAFTTAEAVGFFGRCAEVPNAIQAGRLVEVLGRLPLALTVIVALQAETGMSWDDMLARLSESPAQSLSDPSLIPLVNFVKVALDQLERTRPAARSLLTLFAWLGAEPVSVGLLHSGRRGNLPVVLSRALENRVALTQAANAISALGLARISSGQRIEIQPLVRVALANALPPNEIEQARGHVQEILSAANPGSPDRFASLDIHRELAAHVVPAGLVYSAQPGARETIVDQIRYRFLAGDFAAACELGELAVATWSRADSPRPEDDVVLRATVEWARALRARGRYQESLRLTSDALARLGDESEQPGPAAVPAGLAAGVATDLCLAGRYNDAVQLCQRRFSEPAERGDREAAEGRRTLTMSLRLTGAFGRAHVIDREDLDAFPEWRDETALVQAANATAEDLFGQGRYREALESQERFLDVGRLSPNDQSLLLGRRTFALALRGIGDVGRAVRELLASHQRCVEALGPDHRYTLLITMSYANALRQVGRTAEAREHARDAVTTYQQTFGADNPFTRAAEINLAAILRADGETIQARHTDQLATAELKRILGDRHPHAIVAMINLATDHAAAGDHAAALAQSEVAYRAALEAQPGHPVTQIAAANLALDQQAVANLALEQRVDVNRVVSELGRLLADDHHPAVRLIAAGRRIESLDIEPPAV